jgi:hypothetical protein
MKKLLVAILAIALMTSPALASNGGGKKKAKKKAKIECKQDKSCNVKNRDPKNCDPKTCQFPTCPKDQKCSTTAAVASNQ